MKEKKKYYNEKQAEYAKKYLKNFDEIRTRVPKGDKKVYMDYAQKFGFNSLNSFVIAAMNEFIYHNENELKENNNEEEIVNKEESDNN